MIKGWRLIKNKRIIDRVISTIKEDEKLDDLSTEDVFTRCLDAFDIPQEDREELTLTYKEIIQSIHENDKNEE